MTKRMSATIVVIGDIGHSPRMCYHAMSLASHGCQVSLVGYLDSFPHENLLKQENLRIITIPQLPRVFFSNNAFSKFFIRFIKLIWLLFALTYTLVRKRTVTKKTTYKMILMQNPPGVPTMMICYMIAKIQKAVFVIDWHNYTFSMLNNNWISPLISALEGFWGRRSDCNFCVSEEMKKDLMKRWSISSSVLYDKPPNWVFKEITLEDKYEFLNRFLNDKLNNHAMCPSIINGTVDGITSNDSLSAGDTNRFGDTNRPFIIVSSTSWTPDEDFSILFEALKKLNDQISYQNEYQPKYPKIFVVITGKGPLKQIFLESISQVQWKNIEIFTDWLTAEDYPKLLSCADIGVSLHTSTTGFDLPMKIVDMFGCKLPVLAKQFKTIHEQVQDNINGILFDTPNELCQILADLTANFPKNQKLIELRKNVRERANDCWENNWHDVFWPRLRKEWNLDD